MKVYVVSAHDWDSGDVLAVFSTLDEAQTYIRSEKAESPKYDYVIHGMKVDSPEEKELLT